MILAFKSADRTELCDHLALLANAALSGSGLWADIEYFVPVPLHWAKRVLRGYNQSLLIAKKLEHPGARVCTDLVRIRYTKEQPSLTPAGRKANVAGAFAVRKGHKFSGKRICLVDDIKTTGATLNECARTLKQAGAERVYALVLAVAGQDVSKAV
jgi:ComF family protein